MIIKKHLDYFNLNVFFGYTLFNKIYIAFMLKIDYMCIYNNIY